MNIDRTKLEKLFDEHFIDEPSSEVFDAMDEIIDYAEKAVKLFAIPVVSSRFIRQEAKKQIYKCKESCYGKKTNASNVSEGDYGNWTDWEDVLVKFAKHILKNSC